MTRNQGRHRIARRTKIATALLGLSIAVGGLVVSTTTGDSDSAAADEVDKSLFVDITKVRPNVDKPEPGRNASTGSFTVDCGKNENGHFNPDNFIAQPGIRNGAQHLHDYVGNLSTNADSDNESLLGAGTTCENGDESAYFWPVVRIDTEEEGEQNQAALEEPDADNELAGNDGEIQRPATVDITFKGNAREKVKEMPKFLRILYGDAKATANGPVNARKSWTCTGSEDRLVKQYPICPEGSDVKRVHTFPSCLDGNDIDSENHRDHIKYPNENGECANGLTAVPELTVSLTYKIPRAIQIAGQYKVDSFPEEDHNPFSDHDDFANVMSEQIMDRLVDCVNGGRKCRE
ncbi:DUF1996 domain-containing protein [Amycolatopsis regifaucium]|uniref:DUF1996 domain-containing protein n=1 Tax=Amycolatopsis regifaucium TaxID=546365 RepID=A0A154MJ30_9PSEU|nr:DUF1996 domain-containing protein [Amycolatopsis regifaucium]KZB84428.1 hypothetical protein AVL48_32040 [Amycolatopsis regifaucium]OKA10891.1 hypothetical protein ATP06_0201705 [Amycolatopsis regifaucium]SFI21157.1 protein of unknown function [Amycolatopsis regifaucium]